MGRFNDAAELTTGFTWDHGLGIGKPSRTISSTEIEDVPTLAAPLLWFRALFLREPGLDFRKKFQISF